MTRIPVLVVDDDEGLRTVCALSLRLEGFEVQTANDGLAALRLLETFQAAVIVLDLRMPFADGHAVLKDLQETPHTRDTPVIVISGDDGALQLARAKPSVVAAFHKPFCAVDLISAILRAVRLPRDLRMPS